MRHDDLTTQKSAYNFEHLFNDTCFSYYRV